MSELDFLRGLYEHLRIHADEIIDDYIAENNIEDSDIPEGYNEYE